MDLGIAGRTAIVCASSSGLGKACTGALAKEGVHVVLNGRTAAALEAAAEEIRADAPNVSVKAVRGSVTDPECRAALIDAADGADILVNNAGGPPPGDFREWDRDTWIAALETNMLAAVEMIKLSVDGMASRGFGRIVNITSSTVRVPIPVLGLSNAARAGLTNFVFGLV
ncbi:MAG: SDR family NAD(P)-dependent oxidoreductase, partial [Sphingomonadales bacterium]|nr:SDR family NAD(P)-dependent oxidoreductase [Sphingomonadales bacterium]